MEPVTLRAYGNPRAQLEPEVMVVTPSHIATAALELPPADRTRAARAASDGQPRARSRV